MSVTIPFLTEIDTRAEVKGSRDPLGLVAIWAAFRDCCSQVRWHWPGMAVPCSTRLIANLHCVVRTT